jgi:hypothetical protein
MENKLDIKTNRNLIFFSTDTINECISKIELNRVDKNINETNYDLIIVEAIITMQRSKPWTTGYNHANLYRATNNKIAATIGSIPEKICFLTKKHEIICYDGKVLDPEKGDLLVICCVGILKNKTSFNIVYIDINNSCFIVDGEKILFTKTAIGFSLNSRVRSYENGEKIIVPFINQFPDLRVTHHLLSSGIDLEEIFNKNDKLFTKLKRDLYEIFLKNMEKATYGNLPKYEEKSIVELKDGDYVIYPYVICHVLDDNTPLLSIKGFCRKKFLADFPVYIHINNDGLSKTTHHYLCVYIPKNLYFLNYQ